MWARGPRVVFCHHVHAEMWRMVLPGWKARFGELVEFTLAPPLYRGTRIVTLSESSKRELVDDLGLRDELISVVPPGIDARFTPTGQKAERFRSLKTQIEAGDYHDHARDHRERMALRRRLHDEVTRAERDTPDQGLPEL